MAFQKHLIQKPTSLYRITFCVNWHSGNLHLFDKELMAVQRYATGVCFHLHLLFQHNHNFLLTCNVLK